MKRADYSNQIYEDDDVDREFSKMLSEIETETELEELSFRGNGLTSRQLKSLSSVIAGHSNLRILNLGANPGILSGDGVEFLKKIIVEHKNLRYIGLDFCNITDENIKSLLVILIDYKEEILGIDFYLSCNLLTEDALRMSDNSLSANTTLSILSGNSIIQENSFVHTVRTRQLKMVNPEVEHGESSGRFTPKMEYFARKREEPRVEKALIVEVMYALSAEDYEIVLKKLMEISQVKSTLEQIESKRHKSSHVSTSGSELKQSS